MRILGTVWVMLVAALAVIFGLWFVFGSPGNIFVGALSAVSGIALFAAGFLLTKEGHLV
jgi:hypothetical protein